MQSGIGIAWLGMGVLLLLAASTSFIGWRIEKREYAQWIAAKEGKGGYSTYWAGARGKLVMTIGTSALSVFFLFSLVLGFMSVMPQYRLWRASIEKRILVEEARAQADSAVELARAEVGRARGTAEANLIVADSITEPYLRYLYINSLAETQNQVIYLPTEAGLPILEADRLREEAAE